MILTSKTPTITGGFDTLETDNLKLMVLSPSSVSLVIGENFSIEYALEYLESSEELLISGSLDGSIVSQDAIPVYDFITELSVDANGDDVGIDCLESIKKSKKTLLSNVLAFDKYVNNLAYDINYDATIAILADDDTIIGICENVEFKEIGMEKITGGKTIASFEQIDKSIDRLLLKINGNMYTVKVTAVGKDGEFDLSSIAFLDESIEIVKEETLKTVYDYKRQNEYKQVEEWEEQINSILSQSSEEEEDLDFLDDIF